LFAREREREREERERKMSSRRCQAKESKERNEV